MTVPVPRSESPPVQELPVKEAILDGEVVSTIAERGRDLFAAVERLDLEGIVAKWKADPYMPGLVWYKIKSRTYTQGEGRWELFQRK